MSRCNHDYTLAAESFCQASANSCMIASDCIFVYKIMSNQVKCRELAGLFPIYSPNYVLRSIMPFYSEIPTGRQC